MFSNTAGLRFLISESTRKLAGHIEGLIALAAQVVELALLGAVAVETCRPARQHFRNPWRRLHAFAAHPLDGRPEAQRVPDLERAEVPGEAPLERVVDVHDGVGDLAHAVRGVDQHVAEDPPGKGTGAVGAADHRLDARGAIVDSFAGLQRRRVHALLGSVLAGLPVQGVVDVAALAVLLALEEARLGFAAELAALEHCLDEVGNGEDGARLVVRAALLEGADDVERGVEADQVDGAERRALRAAEGRAGDRIDLVDLISHVEHRVDRRHDAEDADPVGHEVRRVLGAHDALAKQKLAEVLDEAQQVGIGVGARHHFEQTHVTHRVEEVRNEEILAEIVRAALDHPGDRQAGGVRRDDGAGAADLLDAGEYLLLDVQALDDDLDDPVALGETTPVVLEVADLDQWQEALGVDRRGLRLLDALDAGERELVAEARVVPRQPLLLVLRGEVLRHDVEHQRAHAGVGEVRSDPRAHHPGAEHGNLADLSAHESLLIWTATALPSSGAGAPFCHPVCRKSHSAILHPRGRDGNPGSPPNQWTVVSGPTRPYLRVGHPGRQEAGKQERIGTCRAVRGC